MAQGNLSPEKYEELFDAYRVKQSANHVSKATGVAHRTARRYIDDGDPARGLEALAIRFTREHTEIIRRREKKNVYTETQARVETMKQLRDLDDVIALAAVALKKALGKGNVTLSQFAKALQVRVLMLHDVGLVTEVEEEREERVSVEGRGPAALSFFGMTGKWPEEVKPAERPALLKASYAALLHDFTPGAHPPPPKALPPVQPTPPDQTKATAPPNPSQTPAPPQAIEIPHQGHTTPGAAHSPPSGAAAGPGPAAHIEITINQDERAINQELTEQAGQNQADGEPGDFTDGVVDEFTDCESSREEGDRVYNDRDADGVDEGGGGQDGEGVDYSGSVTGAGGRGGLEPELGAGAPEPDDSPAQDDDFIAFLNR